MICEKVAFESHKAAMLSVSRQKKKDRHKYQAYKCKVCGFWHTTTVTKSLKPLREDKLIRKYPFKFDHFYNGRNRKK